MSKKPKNNIIEPDFYWSYEYLNEDKVEITQVKKGEPVSISLTKEIDGVYRKKIITLNIDQTFWVLSALKELEQQKV